MVSVDSTLARAHHDAAGMAVREEVLAAEWTQRGGTEAIEDAHPASASSGEKT
jgi:hypothetical protein